MKPLFKTLSISVISAVIGGAIVFAALKYNSSLRVNASEEKTSREALWDDDFFSPNNPFEEMKKMHQQMEKRMAAIAPSDGTVNDISKREDSEFVYYDILLGDLKETSVNAKIENGYITISGSLEKKVQSSEEENSAQSIFQSTFHRTFPLPENIDQNKMQMNPEKDKVVLRFPKLKSYGTSSENKKNLLGHLTI